MARTKEFNPEKTLDAAVEVFWQTGYERTSLDDLMNGMGIARQSLYDTFGDKRALYLKVLERYRDGRQTRLREAFGGDRAVKKAFARLFEDLVDESRKEHERGCLLLSANVEVAAHDQKVAALLQEDEKAVVDIFERALRRAKKRGELRGNKDPEALARFFLSTLHGMRATARLDHDRKALRKIASVALAALD
jgi:TetR/AcrR family transcriptional regulator, transcriptional repressor for nem operon